MTVRWMTRAFLAAAVAASVATFASAQDAPDAPPLPAPAPPPPVAEPAVQSPIAVAVPACRFSGNWTLNPKLSDDPATAVPRDTARRGEGDRTPGEGEQGGRGGYGGGGGGFGGRGGRGGGRGGGGRGGGGWGGHEGSGGSGSSGDRPSSADSKAMDAAMQLMREMPSTVIVAQHEDAVQIVEEGGRITSWKVDGKPHLDDRFGTVAQAQIRWDGETLRADTPLGSSGAFDEAYALVRLADGKPLLQVTRTLKMVRGSRTISVRRVYEPAS
jgi:hypothetical protein